MTEQTEQELQVADNLTRLAQIAYDYNEYRVAEGVAKEGKEEAKNNIMNYFAMTNTPPKERVVAGLFAVSYSEVKGKDVIDKAKLLALGVSPSIIELATKKGTPTKRISVKLASDPDEDDTEN